MTRWFACGWLLALVSSCQDGNEDAPADAPMTLDCTLQGCRPAAEFGLPYAGDEADLVGGTGRVCLNELCGEVTITSVPQTDDSGSGNDFQTGNLIGDLFIFREDGQLSVRASILQYTQALTPGDVYALRYSAEDGRVLVEGRWDAPAYVTSYPNGVACGPTCLTAQLAPLP